MAGNDRDATAIRYHSLTKSKGRFGMSAGTATSRFLTALVSRSRARVGLLGPILRSADLFDFRFTSHIWISFAEPALACSIRADSRPLSLRTSP